jgi:hypothetical protein
VLRGVPERAIRSVRSLSRELREALVALNDPDAWTPADADAFWKSAEKARFN